MSENDFRFGDGTIKSLEVIEGITPWIIRSLRQTCAMVVAMPDKAAVRQQETELKRFLGGLENFSNAMAGLSGDSYFSMFQASRMAADTSLHNFGIDDLIQTHKELMYLAKIASDALAYTRPVKGRPPKYHERQLAWHTAMIFRMRGLPLTVHCDGPYMRVLEALFKQIFPTDEETGHLRHGKWACTEIKKL